MATGYTTRQPLPYLIELGRDTLLTVPVYLDGVLVAPTAGTVTVYNASNTAVVDAAAVTITGSVARYTVLGSATSALSPGTGWRVEWTLTVTGATDDVVFRDEAYLVRNVLRPVIADEDIGARIPVLRIGARGGMTTATTYADAINEADIQVQSRLLELGRRPNLVVSPSALRESWLTLTIATIYDGLAAASGDDSPYAERAAEWTAKFEAAFSRARVAFDWADDGVADAGARVGPRTGAVWLC